MPTTKLETIHTAVAAHFAEWDSYSHGNEITKIHREKLYSQHSLMVILRDLLPLLDAAVAWDSQPIETTFDESVLVCDKLGAEVAKLLVEAES